MGLRNKFYRLDLYYTYICLVFCGLSYLMESYYTKLQERSFFSSISKNYNFLDENCIVICFKLYNLFVKESNNLTTYVL